jgi:3-methyladenine DNA glycosylase AlkD
MKNLRYINNWDLVDVITPKIVGAYLLDKPVQRKILYTLAKSKDLWERRIAIVATHAFIRSGDFSDTLKISKILLGDKHDLIHKATGWMLREVGKKDLKTEEEFLDEHHQKMPRTMLRYSIEKFEEEKRKRYLKK